MLFRRKKSQIEPELTKEEMEELVEENFQAAKRYAYSGNVSGMEMSLEMAMKYAHIIGRSFDSLEVSKIKLIGYERGEKLMRERSAEFQKAGKIREAQNATNLAEIYAREATLLKRTL